MVRTDNGLFAVTLPLYQLMRPVLADIVEGKQYVIAISDTEKPLVTNLKTEVIPGVSRLRDMTHILPGSNEKARAFLLIDRVAGVVRRIQGTNNISLLNSRVVHNLINSPPGRYPDRTDVGESAQYWQ